MLSLFFVALAFSTCVADEVGSGRRGVRSFATKATNNLAPSTESRRELTVVDEMLVSFICSQLDSDSQTDCVCGHLGGITAITTPCAIAAGGFASGVGWFVGLIALDECIDAIDEYVEKQDELEAVCNQPVTIGVTHHGYGYNNALRMRTYQTNSVPEWNKGKQDNLHRLDTTTSILNKQPTADNLFTSGPDARGIDFRSDSDWLKGSGKQAGDLSKYNIGKRCREWNESYRSCTRNWWGKKKCKTKTRKKRACDYDFYMVAFTGIFTAQESGSHEFGIEKCDDICTVWLDLDQNGSFSEDERLRLGVGQRSVELTAGQSYKFASTYGEYTGGAAMRLTIMSPAQTEGRRWIDPTEHQQRGMWNSGDEMFSPPEEAHVEVISTYRSSNNYCVDGFGADVDNVEAGSFDTVEACTAECDLDAACSAAEYTTRGGNQGKCYLVTEARHAMHGRNDGQDREMKCYVRQQQMAVRMCRAGENCCMGNADCTEPGTICYESSTDSDLSDDAACTSTPPADYEGCFCQAPKTPFPTTFPTEQPTDFPTEQPTSQPTDFPTSQPTLSPTQTPTNPTMSPTQTPTHGTGNVIYTHTGAQWGSWGSWDQCPHGSWAQCINVKIESDQGWGDDSALNSIKLTCKSTEGEFRKHVTSNQGHEGHWRGERCCPGNGNFIVAYRWRGESSQFGDDTAGNGIRVKCKNGEEVKPGDGYWGSWSNYAYCPAGQSVFKMQSRVEGDNSDDTGMGAVKFGCGTMAGRRLANAESQFTDMLEAPERKDD